MLMVVIASILFSVLVATQKTSFPIWIDFVNPLTLIHCLAPSQTHSSTVHPRLDRRHGIQYCPPCFFCMYHLCPLESLMGNFRQLSLAFLLVLLLIGFSGHLPAPVGGSHQCFFSSPRALSIRVLIVLQIFKHPGATGFSPEPTLDETCILDLVLKISHPPPCKITYWFISCLPIPLGWAWTVCRYYL